MNDRELLELAAKAAGYEVNWTDKFDAGLTDACMVQLKPELQHFRFSAYPYERWHPLTDDGDALRLAVKMRLTIRLSDSDAALAGINTCQSGAPTSDGMGPWFWKEWNANGDAAAATRRAIVRAAAEIGKAMP